MVPRVDSQRERTLILIKPDAVRRGLVGKILQRVEDTGLAIVALEMRQVSEEFAGGHYATTDAQLAQMGAKLLAGFTEAGQDVRHEFGTDDPVALGRMIHDWNLAYLTSGPVVAAVVDGYHAVKKVRALCGSTMPLAAGPGTIRGDFSSVSALVAGARHAAVRNLVHASDNELDPEEPEREIAYWFGSGKLCEVDPVAWQALQ
jgi:nucleoside-diphosphate kinase